VPKQPDPTPKGRDEPRLLSPGEIVNFVEPGTHGNWKIDTFTGRALAGQCYMSFTGRRLLIEVLQGAVVYLIVDSEKPFYRGLMFAQSKKGFISDVKYWAFTEGAKGAQGMKTIAEWEAAIGYGIATKLNAAAWVACVGVAGLVFFDTHRHKFAGYRAALTELMLARDVLRGHCPTLYNELFDYVLYNTLKNIPTAFARDPNIMGVVLGSLIGFALKVRKLDERRDIVFEVSKLLLGVAWNVMKSLPGTGEETAEETAEKMVEILRTRNVNFSKVKAVKIVMEVKENAHAVEYSLKRIHKAWELVK